MNPNEADAFALALEAAAVDSYEVRDWADACLGFNEAGNDELLGLSALASRAEAISLLHTLARGSEKSQVSRLVLGHLKRAMGRNTLSHQAVADTIARMASLGYVPEPTSENKMLLFAEYLGLAEQGILPREELASAKHDIEAFLEKNAA